MVKRKKTHVAVILSPAGDAGAKTGRPTSYTPELRKEICDAIACTAIGLRDLCANNAHWPERRNIYHWLEKHEDFRHQYARAKQCQVDVLIDEILAIADDSSCDFKTGADDKQAVDYENINRARLRIDTRKWLAAKLCPKLYGEKMHYDGTISVISHEEALSLLK